MPPPVSAPYRVAAPLKLRRQTAAFALAQSARHLTARGPLAPSSLRQRELVEDGLLELVRVGVRVRVRARARVRGRGRGRDRGRDRGRGRGRGRGRVSRVS